VEWKRRGWDGKSAFFRSLFSGGTEAAVVVTIDRVFLVPVGSKASFSRRSRASKVDVPESFDRAKKYKKSSMKETYKKTKRQKDKKTKRQKDKKTKRQKDKKTKRQKDKPRRCLLNGTCWSLSMLYILNGKINRSLAGVWISLIRTVGIVHAVMASRSMSAWSLL